MNIMDCEKAAGRERSTKSGEEWEGSFAPGRVSFYRMTSESTMTLLSFAGMVDRFG